MFNWLMFIGFFVLLPILCWGYAVHVLITEVF